MHDSLKLLSLSQVFISPGKILSTILKETWTNNVTVAIVINTTAAAATTNPSMAKIKEKYQGIQKYLIGQRKAPNNIHNNYPTTKKLI